jgi:hypothetical protein
MKLVFIRAFITQEICSAKSNPHTAKPRKGATTSCPTAHPFWWENHKLHKSNILTLITVVNCIKKVTWLGGLVCARGGVE